MRKGFKHTAEAKERIAAAHRGKSTTLGFRHSEESKKKMSDALKGHVIPEEVRLKISQAKKGKKLSEEARQHISEGKKGKPINRTKRGYTFSWNISDERRKEVADIYKGRKYTDESKLKMVQNHHNPYRVIIDGKEYNSLMEASRMLGLKYTYLRAHKKNPEKLKELFGIELNYIDE